MPKKRVLIVGAGAAGMSTAHHLTLGPNASNYHVTLVEASDYCGGQAFSIPIDEEWHGASWLNQGVQGGSHIFHHTLRLFERYGTPATPVELQVSFGKGDTFWTNVFPTKLVERHARDIGRFKRLLTVVRWTEPMWALVPCAVFLRLFLFSREFIDCMILPSLALFLGTGNATPQVPTIILERLFTSPTYGMWYPADAQSLISNLPPMVVFPKFADFYGKWEADLRARGVDIRLSTEVTRVLSRSKKGVRVALKSRTPAPDKHNPQGGDPGAPEVEEEFDELVLCTLADTSKSLLGMTASWLERRVLGAAKFSDDITVTHWDAAYMERHYTNRFDAEQAVSSLSGTDQSAHVQFGKNQFRPAYYIKEYKQDMRKLEMCFDCTNYQSQFPKAEGPEEQGKEGVPFERHVFQTIFLNKKDEAMWDRSEIDKSKVIREDWWHQLCHSWTHYLFLVPWLFLLQGRRSTWFGGSWTLLNAHEVAILSGAAIAYRLGAGYPQEYEEDAFGLLCFRAYLALVHWCWYSPKKGKGKGKERWEAEAQGQVQGAS
ncbi:FAD/NAD(P)-binding domain-containing protein [Calocera viscosa TUFC12733]|uniref:FAD/NAD(P)-binding domain-containing protein n=1 Tax=Calocera viscosa (strain TUFC12733) TaxID=1330018 RepID=A0A167RTQ9_CALVF|nr:FAD/NAD(P)-binding domain-containing protein [Calocera viscosa TUFC12733]